MRNNKGFSLIELLITIAIICILAGIGIPGYLGMQARAARSEAAKNLEALRNLQEQLFAETASYAPSTGVCASDNDNVGAIEAELPGFEPGTGLNFSYCLQLNVNITGAGQPNCFTAMAFGNSNSRVAGEVFAVDCNNNKTY